MQSCALRQRIKTLQPAPLNALNTQARVAWDLMGGEIEWAALDTVAAIVAVTDVEQFVRALLQIRNYQQKVREAANG